MPIDSKFDLRYLPVGTEGGGADREVSDDDLDASVYSEDQIDLNELLREQFYLALPMKPLCRDDCAGLCPQCGTNRNTATCACAPQWEDPRLAPLKRLKSSACQTQHADTPRRARPNAARTTRCARRPPASVRIAMSRRRPIASARTAAITKRGRSDRSTRSRQGRLRP